jgi:hypothetical protein
MLHMRLLPRRNGNRLCKKSGHNGFTLEGRVLVSVDGQPFKEIGKNRITKVGKLAILRILAMTDAHEARDGVAFINDEGVSLPEGTADSDLTPRKLRLGSGTRPSSADDIAMQSPYGDVFNLVRVDVRDTVAAYGTEPVKIAWEFDIPVGPLDLAAVGGTNVNSDLMINEWGLFANNGTTLLARSQSQFLKNTTGSFVARWEWWIA